MDMQLTVVMIGGALWTLTVIAEIAFKVWLKLTADYTLPLMERYDNYGD